MRITVTLGLIGMEGKMANWKTTWCRVMHDDIAYGGGEDYWCRKCLCRFLVLWLSVGSREGETSTATRRVQSEKIPMPRPMAA